MLAVYGQGWLDAMTGPLGGTNTDYCGSISLWSCRLRMENLAFNLELNGLTEEIALQQPRGCLSDHVAKSDSQSRALQAGSLRLELTDRIVTVRHIANALIFLGLIGTVIGFIIALSAVDPNAASDAENVAGVIATLIDGMSVAHNTTLVGATLYLWLTVNYRILTSGTVTLIAEVIGLESDVHQLDELDEDNWGTVFRDVILLALIGFVAMVIIMLPHIKPTEVETQDHKALGNVIVELHWPSNKPFDVDLWVKAPREAPIGFWNMGGETFNLLRDDLGSEADVTNENYEISYSRGIPAGEYIVNVHQYGPLPIGTVVTATVVVSVRTQLEAARQILTTNIELVRQGQEVTAFRFRLDQEGNLCRIASISSAGMVTEE